LSNEPGYYKTAAYGIRIENLVLVIAEPEPVGAEKPLNAFETLTLAPIDRRLVDAGMLGDKERHWLDAYHERVRVMLSPLVDAFITDTFDPATGASGATGRTHDWNISRRLVEISRRPVLLAGGLAPDNVAEAIRRVRPAGVDSHTGVEDSAGRKDRDKVSRFVAEARRALERRESGS